MRKLQTPITIFFLFLFCVSSVLSGCSPAPPQTENGPASAPPAAVQERLPAPKQPQTEPETKTSVSSLSPSLPAGYQEEDYYGTLDIPAISLHVELYCANIEGFGKTAQKVTDRTDSAAYFLQGMQEYIADHDYQGFQRLMELPLGSRATITNDQLPMQFTYECVAAADGRNDDGLYLLPDTVQGSLVLPEETRPLLLLRELPFPYLILYTCNGDSKHIYLTFWQRI